ALACAVLLSACQPRVEEPFPIPEGAHSLLLAYQDPVSATLVIYGIEPLDRGIPIVQHRQERLTAIVYPRTLSEMGIILAFDGTIVPPTPPDLGRPLPRGLAVFSAEGAAPFTLEATTSPELQKVRIRSPDLAACIAAGGCFDFPTLGYECKT